MLRSTGSRREGFSSCGTRALERRFSSCGARALLLHGMWDLPGPGLEPVSPALAGGFFTTAPPGKPSNTFKSIRLAKIRQSKNTKFWRSMWKNRSLGTEVLIGVSFPENNLAIL